MASTRFAEIVSHFAGYLRIFDDIARDRTEYDAPIAPGPPVDYTTPRPDHDHRFTPDDMDSAARPAPGPMPDSPIDLAHFHPIKAPRDLPNLDDHFFPPSAVPNILLPMGGAGGGGGGGGDLHIKVVYQPGDQQSMIDVQQHNIMFDDATMLPGNAALPADVLMRLDSDILAAIRQMADDANAHIPTDWWMPHNGTGSTDFLTAHDANWAANGGMPDPNAVQPGYYLNGALQNPAPPAPDLTPLAAPASLPSTGSGLGQWAVLGNNDTTNSALIVDLTHSARTMVVMGDYFKTNAIFQTNTMVDDGHIIVSGGHGTATMKTGGDAATNIADFVQHPGIYATVPAHFAGRNWSVDVVKGDHYNVHTVAQTNYLFHNNILTQTSADTHYDLVAGHNQLGNLAQIFDGSVHYDLIVAEGAYHGMNVIFENNVLLNNYQIKMAADGTDPSQSVTSGHNNLLNEATIENYGGDKFSRLNADVKTIDGLLAAGATSLDPNLGAAIAGTGGTFHVLYITGNYYDVNAIWQANITDDVNALYQLQKHPSADAMAHHRDGTVVQSVSVGGDRLANNAAIIDVNPDKAYVNGHIYSDSILVQANLLPVHQDQAVNADTHALVPELVAFVNDAQDPAHHSPTCVHSVVHTDPMASMLH